LVDINKIILYPEKVRNIKNNTKMKPIVFIAVGDKSTVVVTPNSSHTHGSWQKVEEKIRATYIRECIVGSNSERCSGITEVLAFFKKHPEWECTFSEGIPIYSHLLVE
jgi:hypothetical protein